jgi:hypothetical protein
MRTPTFPAGIFQPINKVGYKANNEAAVHNEIPSAVAAAAAPAVVFSDLQIHIIVPAATGLRMALMSDWCRADGAVASHAANPRLPTAVFPKMLTLLPHLVDGKVVRPAALPEFKKLTKSQDGRSWVAGVEEVVQEVPSAPDRLESSSSRWSVDTLQLGWEDDC